MALNCPSSDFGGDVPVREQSKQLCPVISILDFALEELAHSLRFCCNAAGIAIALESNSDIRCRAVSGEAAPPVGTRVHPGRGVTGYCISSGEDVVCSNTEADPRADKQLCRSLGISGLVVVPIRHKNRVVGVVEGMFDNARFVNGSLTFFRKAAEEVTSRVYGDIDADYIRSEHNVRIYVAMFALIACGAVLYFSSTISTRHASEAAGRPRDAVHVAATPPLSTESPPSTYPGESRQAESSQQSIEEIRKEARSAIVNAQYELAQSIEHRNGAHKDLVEACALYLLASFGGHPQAEQDYKRISRQLSDAQIGRVRLRIGQLFAKGTAVPRDTVTAYRWFLLAAAAGDTEARLELDQLSQEMTAEQLAGAKGQAEDWLKRQRRPSQSRHN